MCCREDRKKMSAFRGDVPRSPRDAEMLPRWTDENGNIYIKVGDERSCCYYRFPENERPSQTQKASSENHVEDFIQIFKEEDDTAIDDQNHGKNVGGRHENKEGI